MAVDARLPIFTVTAADLFGDDAAALIDTHVLNEVDRRRDPRRFDAATYVGRTFAGRVDAGFGNPIRLRDDTIDGRLDCLERLNSSDRAAAAVRRRVRAGELDGDLACWCHPDPCHAWILTLCAHGHHAAVHDWAQRRRLGDTDRPARSTP
jgi:hypothetical protein